MYDVSEVSPVSQGRVEVGSELMFDELHSRLVSRRPDGLCLHTGLVEGLQLPELTFPGVWLAQPED